MMRTRQRNDARAAFGVCLLRAGLAIEAEVAWFFNMADCEMGVGSNFLPLLESGGEMIDWTTPEDRLEAAHTWRLIRGWLRAMPDSDAGVLQAAYEPRTWPRTLRDELGALTGIVVRLACSLDPWPADRKSQELLEMARAGWLDGEHRNRGSNAVSRLRNQAKLRLTSALHAYRVARRGYPYPLYCPLRAV